ERAQARRAGWRGREEGGSRPGTPRRSSGRRRSPRCPRACPPPTRGGSLQSRTSGTRGRRPISLGVQLPVVRNELDCPPVRDPVLAVLVDVRNQRGRLL